MTKLLASAATLLSLVAATAATALPVEPGQSAVVRYADLDLASADGQAVMKRRVRGAINLVCGTGETDLSGRMIRTDCRRYAQANADSAMAEAMLHRTGRVQVAAMTVSGR